MQKRQVHLQPEERDRLIALVSKGYPQANEIRRAYMLLHSADGRTAEAIGKLLFWSEDSVRRTRMRYLHEGLAAALEDPPRSGRKPSLNVQPEAYVVALACSEPPSGPERWTLERLTQRMIDDEQVETLAPETVRLTLKKTSSRLG